MADVVMNSLHTTSFWPTSNFWFICGGVGDLPFEYVSLVLLLLLLLILRLSSLSSSCFHHYNHIFRNLTFILSYIVYCFIYS
jgi:hypothetical protein